MSEKVNESDEKEVNDDHSQTTQNDDKMTTCKACGDEVIKTKIIMHLTRSKKGCKKIYGKEFDSLNAQQVKARKEYKKLKKKEENKKLKEFRTRIHGKICNSDENSDDLDEDDEVQKNFDMRKNEKLRMKEWCKQNPEKLKENRRKRYLKEKKGKGKPDSKNF